jgi:quercetin dioxygenase-like cupin family protein
MSNKVNSFFTSPHSPIKITPNTTRTIFGHDDNLMMLRMDFEKGAVGEIHQHEHTQATYVLSGRFEFTIGAEKKVVREGDACFMPASVLHGCICLEAGALLDVFTPERKDFLK